MKDYDVIWQVKGEKLKRADVAMVAMNFGQERLVDNNSVIASVTISIELLCLVLEKMYREFIDDDILEVENKYYGYMDYGAIYNEWRNMGRPPLRWLIDEKVDVAHHMISEWCSFDLLTDITNKASHEFRYMIVYYNKMVIDGASVTLECLAVERKPEGDWYPTGRPK